MVYELDEAGTDPQADGVGWLLGNEHLLTIYICIVISLLQVITLRDCFCIV
jgi:hypothetical protein